MRMLTLAVLATFTLTGCGNNTSTATKTPNKPAPSAPAENDEVAKERAKLSADDKALVELQEWCVISTDERLGSMGPPIKLDIKGQPVFVCCAGCQKKAESNPEKTLNTLMEHKAKKAGQQGSR